MRVDVVSDFAAAGACSVRLRGVLARASIDLRLFIVCVTINRASKGFHLGSLSFAVVPIHHDDDQLLISALLRLRNLPFLRLLFFFFSSTWFWENIQIASGAEDKIDSFLFFISKGQTSL